MIETQFTPLTSLLGGGFIGLGAIMLMFFRGRVFGATGIMSGLIFPQTRPDWIWRAMIFLGMISGPLVFAAVTGQFPEISIPVSTISMIVGGVIVGIGVTYGAGCTSGHGVCGIARFSKRSIVATVCFMFAASVVVFLSRHVS
jgi:uncharacterized membrane protein YedE/YeeE